MYYGYVRENTDKAMTAFDSFKASYLTTIDQAAAGQIPTEPPTSLTVSN